MFPMFLACGALGLAVASVATAVFGSGPCLAVVGVAEVPGVVACDWFAAFVAGWCGPFRYGPSPPYPLLPVCFAVAALACGASCLFVGVFVGFAVALSLCYKLWAVVPCASS